MWWTQPLKPCIFSWKSPEKVEENYPMDDVEETIKAVTTKR